MYCTVVIYLFIYSVQGSTTVRNPKTEELAEIHFQIGICHFQLNQFVNAQESFSAALKHNNRMAEVR